MAIKQARRSVRSVQEIAKDAAESVATLPEDLRVAAFQKAFDELVARESGVGGHPKPVVLAERTNKGDPTPKSSAKNAARRAGPKQLLSGLREEGYFKSARTIGQIVEYLAHKRAQRFKVTDLSSTLTRMIRAGELERERNAEGQYEYKRPETNS
jgi:hypothetical protein